ncbi:MAG: dihydroorotate dehydrogenase electron transfer subunit [Phycisphaerae bacterium]
MTPDSPDDLSAPPAPLKSRGTFTATIKENRRLCTDHYLLVMSIRRFPSSTPGQFVQVDCTDPHISADHEAPRAFEWPPKPATTPSLVLGAPRTTDPDFNAPLPYLRRPFSIARHRTWPDGYTEIEILHRVVGKGTLQLAQLRPGQKISLLGPLGKGFIIPPTLEHACLVGGGVGIPPMFYLADALSRSMMPNVTAFVGAQRHDLLPLTFTPDGLPSSPEGDPVKNVEEFSEFDYPTAVTTDDGSLGMKGFVTDALRRFLQKRLEKNNHLKNVVVYCCGPTPMMKATARVAAAFNVPCQVSLEQPMACGMGTCQSCIIRFRPHTADDTTKGEWKYKLTCTDGPVFDARDVVW